MHLACMPRGRLATSSCVRRGRSSAQATRRWCEALRCAALRCCTHNQRTGSSVVQSTLPLYSSRMPVGCWGDTNGPPILHASQAGTWVPRDTQEVVHNAAAQL